MRTLGVISKIDQTTGKPKALTLALALALAAIQVLCYDQEALLISHDSMSCVNLLNIVNRYHFWKCFWSAETENLKNIIWGPRDKYLVAQIHNRITIKLPSPFLLLARSIGGAIARCFSWCNICLLLCSLLVTLLL